MLIGLALVGTSSFARADATYQPLAIGPFTQNWTNTGVITVNDDWFGVPGIVGFRGDNLTIATGADPQTATAEDVPGVVDVNINQTAPNTFATGGVAEFELTDPVVALTGSGTADAPYLQIHLDTTGVTSIVVQYNLRDLDGSADNAIQPVALQYRVGTSGVFTNVPVAFVADATEGPSLASKVTAVSATLPATAEGQSQIQLRILTTNAAGNDEWVGIDDIHISGTLPTNLTKIHAIQGSGTTSPLVGQAVIIQGIVTGFFKAASGAREGFYVQEEDADTDGDATTSEGIYVVSASADALQVGVMVNVTGTVGESAGSTRLVSNGVSVLSSGNTLPATIPVTLPFPTATFAERFEGMLVSFAQNLTVTDSRNLGRYGEVTLSSGGLLIQPTNIVAPGAAANALQASNDLHRVILDDGAIGQSPDPTPYLFGGATTPENTLRSGDTIAGATGVFYSHTTAPIIGWRLQPTAVPVFVRAHPRPAVPVVGGNLKVAGFSTYNFFTELNPNRGASNAAELARQQGHLVAALVDIDADVVGLTELQNNGFGSGSAIATLVAALNAAVTNGSVYAFVSHPGYPAPSSTIDEIMCGFIYKTNTVEPAGNSVFNADPIFKILPLAQTFRKTSNGEKITVCVNHFKSKGGNVIGGPDADQGDGQGLYNSTRTQQSQALSTWLATFPTGDADPDVLIIGNLNAFAMEDPLSALETAGFTNLTKRDEGGTGYTFGVSDQWGHLDHALATASLAPLVNRAESWHCNSPEPGVLDYNMEFKSASQQLMNADATPWRFSDHDPVLIGINLSSSPLESWRSLHGLAANGSQDLASAANDGVENLLKYAFNMAPDAGDLGQMNVSVLAPDGDTGLPRVFREAGGHLAVEFVRRKATSNPGVTYQVRTGEDLTNLQPLSLTGANIESIDTTWERVTVIDPVVTNSRFGRVDVIRQP